MGCTSSAEERAPRPAPATAPAAENIQLQTPHAQTALAQSYPVPFGHLPYTPALPGAMGPLWDFPMEWWYYAGWAHDKSKSKQFTILIQAIRMTHGQPREQNTLSGILYGIGASASSPKQPNFTAQWGLGNGFSTTPGNNTGLVIPPPTATSWSLEAHTDPQSTKISMSCALTSGTLGLSGATYTLDMSDETNKVGASLVLKDTFGIVLEGASGADFNKSYEFAMPSIEIMGGTITHDGVTTELGGGNLWLDRQTIIPPPSSHVHSSKEQHMAAMLGASSGQLYTGNWLAIIMNDKTVYSLAFFWPKKRNQWIVGSELDPPVNPVYKVGLKYPPLPNWDLKSPVQGVNVLDSSEYDLNILLPHDPNESPHWTSPTSGQTYCSAWKLRIGENVYNMTAFVPESEVNFLKIFFFEGAATISDDNDRPVGCAFVEQMGYTQ